MPEANLTEEQKRMRQSGIGSSDAAVVVGMSHFRSQHDLWLQKTGQVETDFDSPKMEWGRRLEAVIAEKYAELTGRTLVQGETVRHPVYEWMLATPDRLVLDADGQVERILEIKASFGAWDEWGDEGTDEIPDAYVIQVQHQMEVLNIDICDVAVLLSGYNFRVYTVFRNDALAQKLIEQCGSFWNDNVLPITPPPVDGSAGCRKSLVLKHPVPNADLAQASTRACTLAAELRDITDQISGLTKRKALVSNSLMEEIGDNHGIEGPFGRVTWSARKGTVRWRSVVDEMRSKIPDEVIERHRGEQTRILNTRGIK